MAYKARWIVYLEAPISGVFDVVHASSIELAKKYLKAYGKDSGYYEQVSARLYDYTEEMWDEAMEYKGIGNPFGYPAYLIEFGPKGGMKVEAC